MLTVYRSNRAEWLASVLSEQLRLVPPDPFEKVDIIVNTWPTSRWLGEQLAKVNGISALIRFPFPGTRLRELVKLILGLEETVADPWIKSQLVWHILDVLPELLEATEATRLKERLHQHISNPQELRREEWQLAKSIADAFDEYALYRPEVLAQWIQDTNKSKSKSSRANNESEWQPLLMQLLSRRIQTYPFGIEAGHAIERIKSRDVAIEKLPNQLHIFGVSSLAPVQMEFIQALSGVIDIKIFLLTPCQDLWKRCEIRRDQLGNGWRIPLDGHWLLHSPRLEANFGRMGAEFQQLLEGSGESQLGEWREGDLFAAPTNIAIESNKEPTLLEQLQQQLITLENQKALKRDKKDTSIVFNACPGQYRQVQLVRDQIIQWLAADKSLEPRDILIMTPQIERYSPLITSVFNDKSATNVDIPWKITDRSQQDNPGLTYFMLQFLQTASQRVTASVLYSLLSNQAIQKQQGVNQEDVNKINDYLQLTGFRWGLDAKDREGEEVHSLGWCLDRWLLGLVLPSKPGLCTNNVAPFSEGIDLNDLTRWWGLTSKICNGLKEARNPRTCTKWVEFLERAVKDFFGNGGPWAFELKSFLTAIGDWHKIASGCQLKIEASIVVDILNESLKKEAGRFGHRSGLITISALEPMRAIPHRVIVLMGLDSDVFPRHKDLPAFHLLANSRQLGDPKTSDKDRYVLLEALMSTRQHLLITWNCRDERTGEVIPAASPVQQWIGYLHNELDEESRKGLLRQPPPNPLARANFLPCENNQPISCDQRHLEARRWLDKNLMTNSIALALPLTWDSSKIKENSLVSTKNLKTWLLAPQRIWLEQFLLDPREWASPIKNLEELDLNELQRHLLLKERFEELKNTFSSPLLNGHNTDCFDWETHYAGQGKLPPKNAASIECDLLEERFQNLHKTIQSLGQCKQQVLELENESLEILWAGNHVVVAEIGVLKSKAALQGWLKHLQICASNLPIESTVVIARNQAKAKENQFEISIQWTPISTEKAKEELNKLKSLASHGHSHCWPIPPESGWLLAKNSIKSIDKGLKAFHQKWNGGFNNPGEKDKPEMQLCFGKDYESDNFFSNESFDKAYSDLYGTLIKYLTY